MRCGSLLWLSLLASCGGAGLGDPCDVASDCEPQLQCLSNVCLPRCKRAPECGDGFACTADGTCVEATGDRGDVCESEVECKPGLACFLSTTDDGPSPLTSACLDERAGHIAGAPCADDDDCRNGTCALGRCIDLCNVARDSRDCGEGMTCTHIPRVGPGGSGKWFAGCLQAKGSIAWNIPVTSPSQTVPLAVPESAQSVSITMRVDDPNQLVGVTHIVAPDANVWLDGVGPYGGPVVRHHPALGQSVLAMPSTPDTTFLAGMYTLAVTSLLPQQDGSLVRGTATPVVTAVAKLDPSVILDLHFYFLNLEDHPCAAAFDDGLLNAQTAVTGPTFKGRYLAALSSYLAASDIALATTGVTYEDVKDHPDLDAPAFANVNDLLKLGAYRGGINVFFVRSLSPAGVQAFSPNPGPAGLASGDGVGQAGVIISLDTLCYESWEQVARLTTRELARYMGLYNVVEIDDHADPINDSEPLPSNLMYYSDAAGGTILSKGQRKILSQSPVLR